MDYTKMDSEQLFALMTEGDQEAQREITRRRSLRFLQRFPLIVVENVDKKKEEDDEIAMARQKAMEDAGCL
jgi:hypothetical protein